VSVLKDAEVLGAAAGAAALALCDDPDISHVTGAVQTTSTGGLDTYSVLLDPLPITRDNLQDALDLEWLTVDELCQDVPSGTVPECP
jgi:D-xylose transport system substrate-binding protein